MFIFINSKMQAMITEHSSYRQSLFHTHYIQKLISLPLPFQMGAVVLVFYRWADRSPRDTVDSLRPHSLKAVSLNPNSKNMAPKSTLSSTGNMFYNVLYDI